MKASHETGAAELTIFKLDITEGHNVYFLFVLILRDFQIHSPLGVSFLNQ